MADGHDGFWSMGFRPFFLFASLHAVFAVALWLAILGDAIMMPAFFDAMAWHRHEMLFGVVGGIIAGFLLTAVPNWTGRPPLSGAGLQLLFLLWIAGRVLHLLTAEVGVWPALIADLVFAPALAVWAGRQIVLSGNRNLPIALVVALFGIFAAGEHLGTILRQPEISALTFRLGLVLVLTLIMLIGGRIVPAFTRNWLLANGKGQNLPLIRPRLEMGLRLVHIPVLLSWAVWPSAKVVAAGLMLLAGLHLIRLAGWRGLETRVEMLILILHIAYLWLPVGLFCLGVAGAFTPQYVPAALHALTAGLIGTMTLAVMMRASLGHGARPLKATWLTNTIFAMVMLGALVRVAASFFPMAYVTILAVSAIFWGGAYLLFVLGFLPIFLARRT